MIVCLICASGILDLGNPETAVYGCHTDGLSQRIGAGTGAMPVEEWDAYEEEANAPDDPDAWEDYSDE